SASAANSKGRGRDLKLFNETIIGRRAPDEDNHPRIDIYGYPAWVLHAGNQKLLPPRRKVLVRKNDCIEMVALIKCLPRFLILLRGNVGLFKKSCAVRFGPVIDKHLLLRVEMINEVAADVVVIKYGAS